MKLRVTQTIAAAAALMLMAAAFHVPSPETEPPPPPLNATQTAALALGQRPWLRQILLLGEIPPSTAEAIAAMRKDCAITWCPTHPADDASCAPGAKTFTRIETAPTELPALREPGLDDVIMIAPPPLYTQAGMAWLREGPLQAVRKITQSNTPVFFHLGAPEAPLTQAEARVLASTLAALRLVFPENEHIIAGAGGWWVGARTPDRLNGEPAAARSLALLKQDRFPPDAMPRLWRSDLLAAWIAANPFIARDSTVDAPPIDPDLEALQRQAWIARLEKRTFWRAFAPCVHFFHGSPTRLPVFFLIAAALILAAIAFAGRFGAVSDRFLFARQTAVFGFAALIAMLLCRNARTGLLFFALTLAATLGLTWFLARKLTPFSLAGVLTGGAGFCFAYAFFTLCFLPEKTVVFSLIAFALGLSLLASGRRAPLWALISAAIGLICALFKASFD